MMVLTYKQLIKQMGRNKIFIALLFILTVLSSLMFYFVMFSIDGNMTVLNALPKLTENQTLFKTALTSNRFLAYNFLIYVSGLTAFVFIMFYYRFFRANKKQIGCLKSLGFKDNALCLCFITFSAVLSVTGAAVGMLGGYFMADVLIGANMRTYSVTGLVKQISAQSLIAGLGGSTLFFCATAFLCYYFVRGKEPGALISGASNNVKFPFALWAADRLCKIIFVKNKFPLRIALRKPLSILLIIVAVMSFSTCMIIGRSLNISSQKVFESQTAGHNYEFDTRYEEFQNTPMPDSAAAYLESTSAIHLNDHAAEEIDGYVVGLYKLNNLYELKNMDGIVLSVPDERTAYINLGLADTYGVKAGDTLTATIAGKEQAFTVAGIAANAKSAAVYVNADELSQMLDAEAGAYNGVLSNTLINGDGAVNGVEIISRAERIEQLNRNAVSNNVSGVINQVVGCAAGAILMFLALYLNFQDNSRDMLILHMLGYRVKHIRKLFVDVYMPIIWTTFALTLGPSILLAKSIQRGLSISTNDYMPFGTDISVIIIVFIILNVIYWLVQSLFAFGMKRVITKEEMSEFVYAE